MNEGPYYLAIPFNGTQEEQNYRMELSLKSAREFLQQGIYVFAPVIYVIQIMDELKLDSKEKRRDVVMPYLFEFLKVSKGLILLMAEGWQNSWGVQKELEFCQKHDIPVFKMFPQQIDGDLASIIQEQVEAAELLAA